MKNPIYETVVYCGRLKEWRILNLDTGTIYSMHFDTEEEALKAIEDGKTRVGKIVKGVKLRRVLDAVRECYNNITSSLL